MSDVADFPHTCTLRTYFLPSWTTGELETEVTDLTEKTG